MVATETKKLQYDVTKKLHARFAMVATGLGITGAQAATQALEDWIAKHGRKAGIAVKSRA